MIDNNNNLVVNFHPFMISQEIDVYQNGVCIKQDFCTIEEIIDKIYTYCSIYDIPRINLCGNKDFISKFANELKARYSYGAKEINIIQR